MKPAGLLWLLAGICYLTAEAVAASAFEGYSYAANYISDLGVPYPVVESAHESLSRLAWVMNAGGFVLDGVLYAAAAFIAARGVKELGGQARLFLALAIVHAVGTIVVGSIHSGPREVAAGTQPYHVIGAAMAILGGNAASIAASRIARRVGAPSFYARASLSLGLLGLMGLLLLEANRVFNTALLPDSIFERVSVYAITIWEVLTGLTILIARPRR